MPILIDGHNLIAKVPGLSLQDADDEEALVRLLVAYAARVGRAVTVVFDPGDLSSLSHRRRLGDVEVLFAPHGTSADELIARRVARSRNPREWLVVTSDLALAADVQSRGARVRGAEEMAAELGKAFGGAPSRPSGIGDRREQPPSAEEVEAWLALFRERG